VSDEARSSAGIAAELGVLTIKGRDGGSFETGMGAQAAKPWAPAFQPQQEIRWTLS
jgi:hypothetical protein